MPETLSVRPRICQQIRSGPLSQWINDFVDVLTTRGYATSVVRRHVRAAAVFSVWLERQRVAATEIDEPLVARFISGLPRWRVVKARTRPGLGISGWRPSAGRSSMDPGCSGAPCPGRRPMRDRAVAAALGRLPLCKYEAWSSGPGGCTGAMPQRFLPSARGHRRPIGPGSLCRRSRRSFRPGPGQLCQSSCRSPASATRAFLRFLATRGVVRAGIEGAVPAIREWKHARLPRALADADVQRVLAAVDQTRPNGLRDRAILLLLSRLGLRAAETAALTVKDVDWHNGAVRVVGKGGRERELPLPADVGAALVAALRSRPPTSPPDVIFVTARPPYRQLSGSTVSDIAKRALRRAGVTVPRPGAHVFRHAFASQMVRRDVPMKTVADLLGHARLETTTIYAKLDRETLATIALPWPGGAR